MRVTFKAPIFLSFCLASRACGGSAQQIPPSGWTLTWSDDFNGGNQTLWVDYVRAYARK